MRWHTHVMGGVASLWVIYPLINPTTLAIDPTSNMGLLTFCAMFGALLPDLDASTSRLQHIELLPGITPFAPIGKLLSRWLGHRGPMHSLAGLTVASVVAGIPISLLFGWFAAAAFVLGYASHLILDAMTVSGIPFLYPVRDRFWILPRNHFPIVTGSAEEEIVFVAFALLAMTLLISTMKTGIMTTTF